MGTTNHPPAPDRSREGTRDHIAAPASERDFSDGPPHGDDAYAASELQSRHERTVRMIALARQQQEG